MTFTTNMSHAERYMSFVPAMSHLSALHLTTMGAIRIMEHDGPSEEEASVTCTRVLYQFPDSSLIWFITTPDMQYFQLCGVYGGRFKRTAYTKAGDTLTGASNKMFKLYPPIWDKEIFDLSLDSRIINGLQRKGIYYIGELVKQTEEEILGIEFFGGHALAHIKERLFNANLKLGTNVDNWVAPLQ